MMARPGICNNVKYKRLVKTLELPRPYVLGLLQTLWEVCYESGNPIIGDSEDIEIAAEWPGQPKEFFEALRDGKWIDPVDGADDLWEVHDLLDNAPDYVRKRASRVRLLKTKDLGTVSSAKRRTTVDNGGKCLPSPPLPSPPLPKEEKKPASRCPSNGFSEAFLSFWKTYPARPNGRKGSKAKASVEFEKIASERHGELAAAVDQLRRSGEYPKNAERFLKMDQVVKQAPWEGLVDDTEVLDPSIPRVDEDNIDNPALTKLKQLEFEAEHGKQN